jgi:hypothetical protein
MTGFDRDEIVFSSKDILTSNISIKTVTWEFLQFNEL